MFIISNSKATKVVSKKLEWLMFERNMSTRDLSRTMEISRHLLIDKISGNLDWLYQELIFIARHLGYSEVKDVFPEIYNHVTIDK